MSPPDHAAAEGGDPQASAARQREGQQDTTVREETEHRTLLLSLAAGAIAKRKPPKPDIFRPLTIDALRRRKDQSWLISGILVQQSFAMLTSPPGMGKSFLALDWALALLSEEEDRRWLGRVVNDVGPVVYIAAEGITGQTKRVDAWKDEHLSGFWEDSLYFIDHPVKFQDPEACKKLVRTLAGDVNYWPETMNLPIGLLIVDTLARCFEGNENDTGDMSRFVDGVDYVRRELDCTVLVLHHTGKREGAISRGAQSLEGACDTIVTLSGEAAHLQLQCVKQKDYAEFAPIDLEIASVGQSAVIRPWSGGFGFTLTLNMRMALRALEDHFGDIGASATAWKSVCQGMPEKTFYNVRKQLITGGYVERLPSNLSTGLLPNGRGSYRITAKGATVLPQIQNGSESGSESGTAKLPPSLEGGQSVAVSAGGSNGTGSAKLCLDCGEPLNGTADKCSECAARAALAWKAGRR